MRAGFVSCLEGGEGKGAGCPFEVFEDCVVIAFAIVAGKWLL